MPSKCSILGMRVILLTANFKGVECNQTTEGGIRQWMTHIRKGERERVEYEKGKKIKWGRKAFTNYARLRTGKGNLRAWLGVLEGERQTACVEGVARLRRQGVRPLGYFVVCDR